MTIRRARLSRGELNKQCKRRSARLQKRSQQRQIQLEKLEDRNLLTVGNPILVGIQPNDGDRLDLDGQSEINVAPSELTLRFDVNQVFDAPQDELNQAIHIIRSGSDGVFDTADDVRVIPGYIGGDSAPNQNEILIRFAETLPDDDYRVDVFATDDAANGIAALRNSFGEAFNPTGGDLDFHRVEFSLKLGAKVEAIVPQPIIRLPSGALQQARNQIDVYFNEEIAAADATNPAFYQLIFTNDTADNTDGITQNGVEQPFPTTVSYTYDAASGISKATLTYSADLDQLPGLPPGTKSFRLRIGAAAESPRPPAMIDVGIDATSDLNTSGEVELLFTANLAIAESYGTSARVFVDEADLGATPVAVSAQENQVFLTLNTNATALATAQDIVDAFLADPSVSALMTATIVGGTAADPTTVVVSNRGTGYSPIVLAGLGSSFATATDLNVFDIRQPDTHSKLIASSIDPQHNLLDFPGSPDEPGHRDIPSDVSASTELHINPDFGVDTDFGVTTILYNFQSSLGQSPQGDELENFITNAQKSRIREALQMWSKRLGLQFLETQDQGLTIGTGDPLAIDPYAPNVANYALNKPNPDMDFIARVDPEFDNGMLILDSARTWNSSSGEDYYQTAMIGIGFLLGLERAGDLPEPTTMAFGSTLDIPDAPPAEAITPGNHDIVHGQYMYRPDSNDIDLYRFEVDLDDTAGDPKTAIMQIETFAKRQPDASLLNTLLTLYREVSVRDATGAIIGTRREVVARNDDYFTDDSYIEVEVTSGTYFLQVTASGNLSTNPENEATGQGGTTQGTYELRFDLRPGVDGVNAMRDRDNDAASQPGTPLDGDADGAPGGVHNFWFRAAPVDASIYIDKSHLPVFDSTIGSISNPYNEIDQALAAAQPGDVVRIVGNPGVDLVQGTIADNLAYEIGVGAISGQVLRDGRDFRVPKGVTVMIDAGAIFKLNEARVSVGSSNLTNDRSGAALQVLGTPVQDVYFTSWFDETIGLDQHLPQTTPLPGDWGGIRFRNDLDNAEGRFNFEKEGVFLNVVNFADIRYGGGRLTIDSVEQVVQPVQMLEARPTVSNNLIQFSADAAMSADPNSFAETNFHAPKFQLFNHFTSDYQRIGPDIHDNRLLRNSTNGLFVSIRTAAGEDPRQFTVPARFNDTDVVHVIAENLKIQGNAGSPLLDVDRPPVDVVGLTTLSGGTLTPGTYNYKVVYFDVNGFEGRPSEVTASITTTTSKRTIVVSNLPSVTEGYVGRRIYRSDVGGQGPYSLVAELSISGGAFIDNGVANGPSLRNDPPSIRGVTATAAAGGAIAPGSYTYRVTFVDGAAIEGPASDASRTVTLSGGNATVQLAGLPTRTGLARRIYRAEAGSSAYVLVGEIPDSQASDTTFTDDGTNDGRDMVASLLGVVRNRVDARLRVDPGIIVKLEGARIEATFGSQFIAEGTANRPVIFTSSLDDRFGAGGTFDTPSDGDSVLPQPADWGGIYVGQGAAASIDHALLTFGGGDTRIEGTFVHFNVLEVHQAGLRLTNSVIEQNADGIEAVGMADTDRIGRGLNEPATIFLRGTQPVISGNSIRDNEAQAVTIDINSFTSAIATDPGRSTGFAELDTNLANRGPLFSGNTLENNPNNGVTIRGGVLTSQAVLDDTDIAHVLFEEIIVPNLHTFGGLRIQSSATSSLVLKLGGGSRDGYNPEQLSSDPFEPHLTCDSALDHELHSIEDGIAATYRRAFARAGAESVERLTNIDGSITCTVNNSARFGVDTFAPTAGITAMGTPLDIEDRIGGVVQLIGEPAFPVVITSFHDDTVGAGYTLEGQIQRDTNNNGNTTSPQPGDWRSVRLEEYSHDRNVEIIMERESGNSPAPGVNAVPENAQFIGELASDELDGDERLRLGFEVHGLLNAGADVDVYSFTADAGTEVWIDIDRTSYTLNSVVELVDSSGAVIARSDDSLRESLDPSSIFHTSAIPDSAIGPLQKAAEPFQPKHASGLPKDFFSLNPLDAGMRLVLPGVVGTRSTYHVRVRSFGEDIEDITAGRTAGAYQLQVRLRETDEIPGSTIRNSEIRYGLNGIEVIGLPVHSPLLGEAAEDESSGGPETNNHLLPNFNVPGSGPQDLGNVLQSDRAVVSIAGSLSLPEDVDFFEFQVAYPETGDAPRVDYVPTVFDIDYADGLARANTNITVFDQFGRVILFAQDSNVADDQLAPLADGDLSDLSSGSAGSLDPYIGPVALPVGTYFVAVSSNAFVPEQLLQNPLVRREPINSIARVVEDHVQSTQYATASLPAVTEFLDEDSIEPLAPERVSLYIVADVEATEDQSDLTAIDPRTGDVKWQQAGYLGNVEDITTKIEGGVYGFSTPDADPAPNDFFTGLLQGVSTSRPQFIGSRDSAILTFEEDPANPGLATRSDVGIRFNATAFGVINGEEVLLAVGDRGDKDLAPAGPDALGNLLFRFDPVTGEAISAPQTKRTGVARLNGGGTDVVERGILDTNVGGGPGGTINGLEILDGVVYALSDSGGLFVVNDPLGLSGPATLTYVRDLVPTNFVSPQFGVIEEVEPNDDPAAPANDVARPQNLDREIWTMRENPDIIDSTTVSHITIDAATGDHGFLGKFVTNEIGSLEDFLGGLTGPVGMTVGPNGNVFVTSNDVSATPIVSQVLEFDGTTGEFQGIFVPPGAGGLQDARDLVFDSNGDLYVSSFVTNEVLLFNGTTGLFERVFASGLNGPTGLIFDAAENLYVANETGNQILRFAGPNATAPFFPGAPLPAPGQPNAIFVDGGTPPLGGGLTAPQGMTFDAVGNLYVNSSAQSAVFRYTPAGVPLPSPAAFVNNSLSPDGDQTIAGWSESSGVPNTPLFTAIDEQTADDSDFVIQDAAMNTALEVTLSDPPTAPVIDLNHIIRYRYRKDQAGGNSRDLTVGLYQGAVLIAERTHSNISSGWSNGQIDLTVAEAALIGTNYGTLQLRFTGGGDITGGAPREIHVSWAQMELPQESAIFVAPNSNGLNNPLLGIEFHNNLLYVGSHGSDQVLRYDSNGDPADPINDSFVRQDHGGLDEPTDLLFHNGRWLVVSANTDPAVHDPAPTAKILRYTEGGGSFVDSLVPAAAGGLDAPRDVAIGPNGDLYVTSAALSDSVLRYDGTTGAFLGPFVTDSNNGLDDPFGITFRGSDLFVASEGSNSVLRYDSAGNFIEEFAEGAGTPRGITFGADGNLYVASFDNDSVLRYDSNGNFLGFFVPSGSGGLVDPAGIQFGPNGDLYVASEGTSQILRYNGTTGAFVDLFVDGTNGLSGPLDLQFVELTSDQEMMDAGNYLLVTSSANNSVLRYDGDSGAFIDNFVNPLNEGLRTPVGMTFRPNTTGGGELFTVSSGTDEVFRYDVDSRGTYDHYEFSVDQDGTEVWIDIDHTNPGVDTVLFLSSGEVSDDFSRFAGGTGSTVSFDAMLGVDPNAPSDPNAPLILDAGTYVVTVAEYDRYDLLIKGVDPITVPTNPLDRNDSYTLHISMTQHDDSAEGPVVVRDFEGLAVRPRQTGGFENVLFAVDTLGVIHAFATDTNDPTNPLTNGVPTPFFLGDDPEQLATDTPHARGLSMSATFLNVTESRRDDQGHGLAEAFDNSRGNGPLIFDEIEPNNTFGSAHNLEDERWTLGYDSNIGDDFDDTPITINTSTFIPHVSINGTGHGSLLDGTATRDFYSFEVYEPDTYVQLELDFTVDARLRPNTGQPGNFPVGALPYGEGLIDGQLLLYTSEGGLLAANDNITNLLFGDGGSNTDDPDVPGESHEPYIDIVLQPGTYVVEVTKFDPETFGLGVPLEEGDSYTLHVSVEDHPVGPGAKNDGGASYFFGTTLGGPITNATPASDVQITSPRHGLLGGEFVYVEGVRGIHLANGTYQVSVVDEDNFELVDADGTDDPFLPDGPYEGGGTWRLIEMPEDMQGAITSNVFSLDGYTREDKPVFYFNYLANLDPSANADAFQVSIIVDGGPPQPILVKSDLDMVAGSAGDTNPLSPIPRDLWRQARIELDDYAGEANLQIRFEFDTLDMLPGDFEGVFLDDFVVGFAERGEMVSNAYNSGLFALNPDAPANEMLTGEYQLEIRRGSSYGSSQFIGSRGPQTNSLQLTETFDTNDRFAQRLSLLPSAGNAITEGDTFTIGDGNQVVTFEFDSNGISETLGSGNALVDFTATDTADQIADNLIAAINSPSVQSLINVEAGPGGLGRVHLFGSPVVSGINVDVHNEQGDTNAFRDQGQVLIHSNFVVDSHDYGILTEAGPRGREEGVPVGFLQPHLGAVRNLQVLNDTPDGGITRGLTIENNVVANSGLGGIHVGGDLGVWEIVPIRPPSPPYPDQFSNGNTSGDFVPDGASFIIEAYGTQVRFEFEDISGDPVNNGGSGLDGGNGWTPGSVPIFYRRSNNYLILRNTGYSQAEMVYAIQQAINSSILVTNGTSQTVKATPYFSRRLGTELLGADPALYLEGVTNVIGSPFSVSRRVPLQQAAQPFTRIVNNTIYGQDGTEAFFPGNGTDEPNDTIKEAVLTHQGSANLPISYTTSASIGDGVSTPEDRSLDVDFYQIHLGVGDRVLVDVDANINGSELNSTVRLFNDQGIEVAYSDDDAAPGEGLSFDSFIDFTATTGGTYFVGVSAAANDVYSALSLGGRQDARTRGDYDIDINVLARREWVLTAVDGTLVPAGTTITVGDRTRTATFELQVVGGPPVTPGNIPIVYDPTPIPANGSRGLGYRPPEMAVVIAEAINAEFPGSVYARALPGVQGQTAGGPQDSLVTNLDYNDRNFGHDFDPTRVGYGQVANIGPFATGERFVVIEGAAIVELDTTSPFQLSPDPNGTDNSNQLLPERGIYVSQRTSATLLNNVLANLSQGVVQTDSDSTIMGASLFQNNTFDHNIDPLNESFSLTLGPTEPLFIDAAGGNFYPAALSPTIDSSIDSLEDRNSIVVVTEPLGISPSPILAPDRDAAGQFRVDDPDVAPPDGFGANVFKDRGGLDRADSAGPTARLVNPLDNDVSGRDQDPSDTVVQLVEGPLRHISIQLVDGSDINEVDRGVGVNDGTVSSEKVTITQNGRLLVEDVDYTYEYDPLSNTIRLTHISGVWPEENVYVVMLNNTDRFVFTAQAGSRHRDGESFTIRDRVGNLVTFEFESGFSIIVPEPLTLHVPSVGIGAGGIADGQQLVITRPGPDAIFEFDSNVPTNVLPGNIPINIAGLVSPADIAQEIVQTITNANIGLSPSILPGQPTAVHLGASSVFDVDLGLTNLTRTGRPGVVNDADTFTFNAATAPVVFEFEDTARGNGTRGGNIPIFFNHGFTRDQLADAIVQAIDATSVNVTPTNVGNGHVHLGGVAPLTLDVSDTPTFIQLGSPSVQGSTQLELPGRLSLQVPPEAVGPGGISDGQSIIIDDGVRNTSVNIDFGIPNTGLVISGPRINNGVGIVFQDTLAGDVAVATFDPINQQLLVDIDSLQTTSATIAAAINLEATLTAVLDTSVDPTNDGSGLPGRVGLVGVLSSLLTLEFENTDIGDGVPAGHVAIPFTSQSSQVEIVNSLIQTLISANLNLAPVDQGNGVILLNATLAHFVDTARTNVTQFGQEGGIRDGETLVISNGTITETFEFNSTGGVQAGNRVIQFSPTNPPDVIASSIVAAIKLTGLGLNPTILPGDIIVLNDTPLHSTDVSGSSLIKTGAPGGAVAIPFRPDENFTAAQFADQIIAAIDGSALQGVDISLRGGNTFFVDGVESIGGDLSHFFNGAIEDHPGNDLQANQPNNTVTFTILMPGVELDYGDAPDPSYPTLRTNNGARHGLGADLFLGAGVSSELDGQPTADSSGDSLDDGVTFNGSFNQFLATPITINASRSGLVDAWIDYNRDGDFDDAGERVLSSVRVTPGDNPMVLPRPVVVVPGLTTGRFRISDLGGLQPDGLAASGEVEDYEIILRDGTPPVAVDDPTAPIVYQTNEDTLFPQPTSSPYPTSVLSNDSDPDANTTLTIFDPGHGGTFSSLLGAEVNMVMTGANAGTFTYDPNVPPAAQLQSLPEYDPLNPSAGSIVDTFTYRAFDGLLFSEEATVSILVTGENDIPVANDLFVNADEDGVPVSDFFRGDDIDSDDDRDSLTYVVTSTVSEGVLTNLNTGRFTFDPVSDFQDLSQNEQRNVTFEYTATDRHNTTSATAIGTVTVTGVNDAPVVANMLVGATEDGAAVTYSFAGSDVDSEDNQATLQYVVFGVPSEGTFTNNNNGTFTFDPGTDFQDLAVGETRDIALLYNATDMRSVTSNLASLTIRVTGVNDAPTAVNDPTFQSGYSTTEDDIISIVSPSAGLIVNDFDVDLSDSLSISGAPLTISSTNGAAVTLQPNGTFVYDPTAAAAIQALNVGESMVDTFVYTLSDGNGGTDSGTVAISVAGRNDVPVAGDVIVDVVEDGGAVNGSFGGSDADAEDDPSDLTYAFVPFTGPSEGTVVNNGDGTFTFDPGSNFQDLGPGETRNVTVQYRATDSRGSTSAPGRITFSTTGSNDPPTAVDDDGGFNPRNGSTEIDVLANDFDIDGSALDPSSVTIVSGPSNGNVSVDGATGKVTYTSTQGFTGSDSFTYRMRDAEGAQSLDSNVAKVTIVTTDLPIADDINVTTEEGTPVDIDLLQHSRDPDGSIDPTSVQVTTPSHGTVQVNGDGSVTYSPTPGYLGQDTFQYQVRDNVGAPSNSATVNVEVVANLVPYRNPLNRYDVNADGRVTPLDMLIIIRALNKRGSFVPDGPRPPYMDTEPEDNRINFLDALGVLNELRRIGNGNGESLPAAMQPIDFGSLLNGEATSSQLPQSTDRAREEMLRKSAVNGLSRVMDLSTDVLDSFIDDLAAANDSRSSNDSERTVDDALLDLLDNGEYGV